MEGRFVSILLLCIAILSLCNAECNTASFRGGEFPRCFSLRSNYDLYWKVEGDKTTGNITIGLNLRGLERPWVGLGISVNGGMKGGDIALTRYDTSLSKYVLEDRFATEFGTPALDDLQNLELISATYDTTSQETIVVYKRQLVPCDLDQDQAILEDSTQVIYAFGVGSFGYHNNNRGIAVVHFHNIPVVLPLPDVHQSINITMPGYTIPAQETTYTCIAAVLPSDQKYHVVRWRPIISNAKYIHHMALFGCYFNKTTTVGPYECSMAPTADGCATVVVAWAVGQSGNDFLGEFALPIGKGQATGVYVVLQVHYNNPAEDAGVVDSSGLELIYTPAKNTTMDVGTVPMSSPWASSSVSTTPNILAIPPGVKDFYRYTRCHSECTSKSIPAAGITMINWFPHMHKLGKKIWMQHIRNGVELPEIHRDNNYDFNRQQNFPINRQILPGDSLIMNCIWDSTSQTTVTLGGEATSNEMCIGIFQFYPVSNLAFTRCTDLHQFLNTSGDQNSYATCNVNPTFALNPYDNKNFSSGVTPVIANPSFVALPPRVSTCAVNPTTTPTSSPSPSISPSPSPSPDQDGSSASLVVAFATLTFCLIALLL